MHIVFALDKIDFSDVLLQLLPLSQYHAADKLLISRQKLRDRVECYAITCVIGCQIATHRPT